MFNSNIKYHMKNPIFVMYFYRNINNFIYGKKKLSNSR